MLKSLGGWGLQNVFLFSKSLETKCVLRLLCSRILWTCVAVQKYISLDFIMTSECVNYMECCSKLF